MKRTRLMVLLVLGLAGTAFGEEPDQALVTYAATVGDRQISGASRSLHWSATQLTGDGAQVRLRVPIDSFDSGHAELDSLIRSVLQSDRYPFIEVEGEVRSGWLEGTITMHGVSRPLGVRIGIERSGTQLLASTSFAIDLDQFGVSAPSVGNRVAVDFVARLSAHPRAVIAGGALSSN